MRVINNHWCAYQITIKFNYFYHDDFESCLINWTSISSITEDVFEQLHNFCQCSNLLNIVKFQFSYSKTSTIKMSYDDFYNYNLLSLYAEEDSVDYVLLHNPLWLIFISIIIINYYYMSILYFITVLNKLATLNNNFDQFFPDNMIVNLLELIM